MKKYDYIAFDLDGTLTDPEVGLVKGFMYAFDRVGIKYDDPKALRRYIGPPLHEEWKREYGFTEEETARAIAIFREYYDEHGWAENRVYEGIVELLGALKAMGKTIVLATSKPENTARRIMSLFGLDKYFDFCGGASTSSTRDKKWEVLEYSLLSVGATDKSRCILIGDRKYDAEGASIYGIDSIGVLWGHGSEEEIVSSGFTYVAKTPDDVLNILK
ncbi:MAG: HAD hydrolase-like protein [Clostridia bacterium]|nr:HAD hydrolase-like protein [Clostridia bacterium]